MEIAIFLILLLSILCTVGMSSVVEISEVGAMGRRKAAMYLGISVRKLDDLLTAGEIQRVKIGRRTLVRKICLDNYLARLAGEAE